MKSTTLRRSNITREKIAMMEALSNYNTQHQDEDFYKAKNIGISNSQLYKQAGNSIVVKVLEGIFKELFLSEKETNKRDFEIVKLGNTKAEQFKWVI